MDRTSYLQTGEENPSVLQLFDDYGILPRIRETGHRRRQDCASADPLTNLK